MYTFIYDCNGEWVMAILVRFYACTHKSFTPKMHKKLKRTLMLINRVCTFLIKGAPSTQVNGFPQTSNYCET